MKNKEKPRLSRLTSIITQLQSKRILVAREVAEKYNISIRTVYRDIETLKKSGIPIYTIKGKGYSLVEGYRLPPIMFTEQEANALITAAELISKNRDKSLIENHCNAISKIKAVMKYGNKDKVALLSERIAFFTNFRRETTSDNLSIIQIAITNLNLLNITYQSIGRNEKTQRIIEPYALYHSRENWILIAYCRLRNDFREFRLDMIKSLTSLSDNFEHKDFKLSEYFKKKIKSKNTPDTRVTK